MKVIAFSGRARCGKSYISKVASRILWDMGYVPITLPLAAPLKDAAAEAGYPKETHPEQYRLFCQEQGAAKREENPDHWLGLWYDMYLDARMRELGSSSEYVIIVDDVRYPNELDLINKIENSTTIFVSEGSRSATLEDADADWRQHHSEYLANDANENYSKYEKDFDFLFVNDGDPFKDLQEYLTAGDNKVVKSWVEGMECDCVLCRAFVENSSPDADILEDQIIEKLQEYLDEVDDVEDLLEDLFEDKRAEKEEEESDDNDDTPEGAD